MDEDAIQRLHFYDWECFKAERNYRRWNVQSEEYISQQTMEDQPEITTTEQLLDEIESPELYTLLSKADKLTLRIILMKIDGFSNREIAASLGMEEYAVNMRIYRLRKNLKNIFNQRYILVFHSGYRVKGKNPFTRSLKSEYQPCLGTFPVQASDARGKRQDGTGAQAARSMIGRRSALSVPERFLLSEKRQGPPFRHDPGRGIMIHTIVYPHVRWAGLPWVVISKTLGKPVNGLSAASLPAWFPNAGGRAANTA